MEFLEAQELLDFHLQDWERKGYERLPKSSLIQKGYLTLQINEYNFFWIIKKDKKQISKKENLINSIYF